MAKKLALVNGIPRMTEESASPAIYSQTYTVPSLITAGTAITLPASGSYVGEELEVRLNGVRQEIVLDYNYVGSGTKTQISFTFDLYASPSADIINFRVDRAP